VKGCVVGLHISEKKGTVKTAVGAAEFTAQGIVGDAHAGRWHRQVSLLDAAAVERFTTASGTAVAPGEFAENVLLTGIDLTQVAPLDRLKIGVVELEITQIGKECHGAGCAVFQRVGECLMPKQGLFARVITPGIVKVGDAAELVQRMLAVHVVTLSDRAAAGEYEDRSGPRIAEMVAAYFAGTRWHLAIDRTVIPDEPEMLEKVLEQDRDGLTDVVITTGGTGIGPRDITPEVILELADIEIPGIMEYVRVKYGADKPSALLSRSIAVVMGETLVFALPGSVRAVEEYMTEILKVVEHSVLMRHGLGH
jgi:molybdenum cofactor synthesis domain-containing protein